MLRKSFAIFFLCVYSLVLLKPLFPFIDYAINKEYIAKNLCENRNKPKLNCNGKCHLMKQLKKSSADVPSDGNTTKGSSNQEENCVHVASLFSFNTELVNSQPNNSYIRTFKSTLPSNYLKDIFHPPQA
ncbi:MAG TPA: hypothetical protein VKG26_03990 [Bacteroidia bacterium]|nr:hypothetical protein [Bacteroidia bacterium]